MTPPEQLAFCRYVIKINESLQKGNVVRKKYFQKEHGKIFFINIC